MSSSTLRGARSCPLSAASLTDVTGRVYYKDTFGEDSSFGCWSTNFLWAGVLLFCARRVLRLGMARWRPGLAERKMINSHKKGRLAQHLAVAEKISFQAIVRETRKAFFPPPRKNSSSEEEEEDSRTTINDAKFRICLLYAAAHMVWTMSVIMSGFYHKDVVAAGSGMHGGIALRFWDFDMAILATSGALFFCLMKEVLRLKVFDVILYPPMTTRGRTGLLSADLLLQGSCSCSRSDV